MNRENSSVPTGLRRPCVLRVVLVLTAAGWAGVAVLALSSTTLIAHLVGIPLILVCDVSLLVIYALGLAAYDKGVDSLMHSRRWRLGSLRSTRVIRRRQSVGDAAHALNA